MPKSRVYPWLNAADYDSVKNLFPDDPELPPTYQEWLELANEQLEAFEKSGVKVIKVEIDAKEFEKYGRVHCLQFDFNCRKSFAVHKYKNRAGS